MTGVVLPLFQQPFQSWSRSSKSIFGSYLNKAHSGSTQHLSEHHHSSFATVDGAFMCFSLPEPFQSIIRSTQPPVINQHISEFGLHHYQDFL